jgi:SAM-dependent methyltransferase
MRLTDKSRWTYQRPAAARDDIVARIDREEWVRKIRETLPDEPLDVLELGCAPGDLSAAIMLNKPWAPFGIDYSDDAALYVETLRGIGKSPTLYKLDLFEQKIDRKFDVVCSFGLIEHFRGRMFDELLELHDHYLKPGGYLAAALPNFTGAQYLWHYLFDRPDLDNHNVDSMQPASFQLFEDLGYETLFNDYVGTFRVWGNSGWTWNWFLGKSVAALAKLLSLPFTLAAEVGLKLRGRSFSPYFLYIGRKPSSEQH